MAAASVAKSSTRVERGEAREAGVDEPEFTARAVNHLVNQNVAGDVAGARQVTGVVRAGGLQAAADVGDVAESAWSG